MPAMRGAVCSSAVHRRIRAEQRRAVAVRQPGGKLDAEARQQRGEVAAPGDRDRDVADRVLEDQVPADDPRDQLAERRVRVGVGAAGLRDHRRQLGVAERRRARTPRRAAGTRGPAPGRRRSGRPSPSARTSPAAAVPIDEKMPGADHRADRQHDRGRPAPSTRFSDVLAFRPAARRSACARTVDSWRRRSAYPRGRGNQA